MSRKEATEMRANEGYGFQLSRIVPYKPGRSFRYSTSWLPYLEATEHISVVSSLPTPIYIFYDRLISACLTKSYANPASLLEQGNALA